MSNCSTIMAIVQETRVETANKVQDVLTKYGCHIRVRLGLHEAQIDQCSNEGLILLQLCCSEQEVITAIEKDLNAIPHVKVKHMILD